MYAESSKNFAVCLAVPRPKQLKALAVSLGIITDDWAEQCRNKAIKDAVLKDLQALGKSCKYCFKYILEKSTRICSVGCSRQCS